MACGARPPDPAAHESWISDWLAREVGSRCSAARRACARGIRNGPTTGRSAARCSRFWRPRQAPAHDLGPHGLHGIAGGQRREGVMRYPHRPVPVNPAEHLCGAGRPVRHLPHSSLTRARSRGRRVGRPGRASDEDRRRDPRRASRNRRRAISVRLAPASPSMPRACCARPLRCAMCISCPPAVAPLGRLTQRCSSARLSRRIPPAVIPMLVLSRPVLAAGSFPISSRWDAQASPTGRDDAFVQPATTRSRASTSIRPPASCASA